MADYNSIPDMPTFPDLYEQEIVTELLTYFSQLQLWRNTFANQWEEIAQLIMPEWRNTFYFGNYNWPGQKKAERQIDATGMLMLSKFSAICDSLLTPQSMVYEQITTTNPDLNKRRDVQLYYEEVTKRLFQQRTSPLGNFAGQQHANYMFLGAFGTMAMFVDAYHDETRQGIRALRYMSIPLGELFLTQNSQGQINGFIRWFRLTAKQCYDKYGAQNFPPELKPALVSNSQTQFDFLHWVCIRNDYDPERLDHKGKVWASYHVSMTGRRLLREGGYNTFPMGIGRYIQVQGEVYGRSAAMMGLPTLKTLNAQKGVFLTQGHRAAAPVLLTRDDALVSMQAFRPGSINPGGVGPNGEELVKVLPAGNIAINEKMMDMEKAILEDLFLVSLFKLVTEMPTLTATQVIEMVNEKGILLAPTVGRQQSEYIGPMTHRELDLMSQLRLLPEMPKVLKDANGEYEVVHTSPLTRTMRAQEAAGAMRTLETGIAVVQATQNPEALDGLAVDRMMQGIAEIQGVPASWQASEQEMQQKKQARQQMQQADTANKALPNQAAMLSAKAKLMTAQSKQGGGQPLPGGGSGGIPPVQIQQPLAPPVGFPGLSQ